MFMEQFHKCMCGVCEETCEDRDDLVDHSVVYADGRGDHDNDDDDGDGVMKLS